MFKDFVSYLIVFSVALMGLESAIDLAGGEHPHEDEIAFLLDGDLQAQDTHDDDGHCSHCCHGHASGITGVSLQPQCAIDAQRFAAYQPSFHQFSQAPPTPPPTHNS